MKRSPSFIAAAAVLLLGSGAASAAALPNPTVVQLRAVAAGAGGAGNVTLFDLGRDLIVDVILNKPTTGAEAVDIRKGACDRLAARPTWNALPIDGRSQTTRLPNVDLSQMGGGYAVAVHKTSDAASPVVACAPIAAR